MYFGTGIVKRALCVLVLSHVVVGVVVADKMEKVNQIDSKITKDAKKSAELLITLTNWTKLYNDLHVQITKTIEVDEDDFEVLGKAAKIWVPDRIENKDGKRFIVFERVTRGGGFGRKPESIKVRNTAYGVLKEKSIGTIRVTLDERIQGFDNYTASFVLPKGAPEPASLSLLALGGLSALRRRS